MKRIFLPFTVFAVALTTATVSGQSNRAFAVTSEVKGGFNWTVVREVDLGTSEVVSELYNPSSNKQVAVNNLSFDPADPFNSDRALPMGQGVAAAAYDAKHNRLYITSMRGTDLRYFDLNAGKMSIVVNNDKNFNTGNKFDEANVITRMTFASDGYGYALTNDGKHLIRFTTDQKPVISDLGALIDGKKNGTMSVHSQCSSWGGDMVGDAYGNLYLVTYRNNIFKINPQSQVADYIGQVKGLPAQFTTNGAVVDTNGELFIASATLADNYYKVNVSTLDATVLQKGAGNVYNTSDLANGNLLYQNSKVTDSKIYSEVKGNTALSIYPNPVTDKTFNVQFEKVPVGQYSLALTDASGRNILTKQLKIGWAGQMERISLPRSAAGGVYMIKLSGADQNVVYTDKIVVQ